MSLVSSEAFVHPMAVVEDGAKIGPGTYVGPFCTVGPEVVLNDNVRLQSHVSVSGRTMIGDGTTVGPHTALGDLPQNKSHGGGTTTLRIGKNCVIRENVTIHVGTDNARGETVLGDNCYIMGLVHIGHDCLVGNSVTMASFSALAGHCEVEDYVIVSGMTAVHQFVRVGHHAFLSGFSAVVGDVIPYGMAIGNRAKLRGLNIVGMKRSGMKRSDIGELRKAVKMLFDEARPITENAPIVIEAFADSKNVIEMVHFITERNKRQYTVPPRSGGRGEEADFDE